MSDALPYAWQCVSSTEQQQQAMAFLGAADISGADAAPSGSGGHQLDLQILQCLAPATAAARCLDAVNTRGWPALAELVNAAYSNRHPCLASVRVVLAAGADPNAAGDEFNRPLRVAVRGCGKEDNPQAAEIVAALLGAGADPKAVPGQFRTTGPMHDALSRCSAHVEIAVMLLEAGACSTGEALADVIKHICIQMARSGDLGSSSLRILQLLLFTQHPKHAKLTASQVQGVLCFALLWEGSYPAAVQLLLYLQQAGGSAAEALSDTRVNDPAALRVALLQGWAAATAEGDAERATVAPDEQWAAAASSGFREMLLGVAELDV